MNINTLKELTDILASYGMPFESWGTGKTKSAQQLFNEIKEGESTFLAYGPLLIREVSVAAIHITATVGGETFKLHEEKQVFANGSERVREALMGSSIAEKMKGDEPDPAAAAMRGIMEELGMPELVAVPGVAVVKGDPYMTESPAEESKSYPGLLSRYRIYQFHWQMPEALFKPEGYVEEQEGKKTYFVWKKAE